MLIAAIDAGSASNLGWAIHDGAGGHGQPDPLLDAVTAALAVGDTVAIGIEAPTWLPAGRAFAAMTRSRGGIERTARRPWSAGAGTGALAAGLANLTWLLQELRDRYRPCRFTTQPDRLDGDTAPILIWEAFVSGSTKASPRSNEGDARLAASAFAARWPLLESLIPLAEHPRAVNLVAAVIAATQHQIAADEFGLSIPVIGPSADLLPDGL